MGCLALYIACGVYLTHPSVCQKTICQCTLAAVFALGGGGSCRIDRYDVRVMLWDVGALGWVSAAFVV